MHSLQNLQHSILTFLFIRDDPSETTSSRIFSFSNPPSAFPSGTGVPGSGGQTYICYPVDPSASSAIPSGSTPTSAPTDSASAPPGSAPSYPTSAPPSPTSGQGGPTYICHPAGPSATPAPIPSDPVCTSDAPSLSAPDSSTGVPPPMHTEKHGPGGPDYVCYPMDPTSAPAPLPSPTLTSITSDRVPTSSASASQ